MQLGPSDLMGVEAIEPEFVDRDTRSRSTTPTPARASS
jgi:hypothetical protein